MKTLLVIILSMALLSFTQSAADTVYVCSGKASVAYHISKNCRGLNKCKHEILEMSVDKAKAAGKRACKICY